MTPRQLFASRFPELRRLIVGTVTVLCGFPIAADALGEGAIKATASAWEQKAKGGFGDFPPEATLDGKMDASSSWRVEGDGEWIQYELGVLTHLDFIKIAFVGGNNRVYTFDVLTSKTGQDGDWTPALSQAKSSGTSQDLEMFKFAATDARFVRLVGHGSTSAQFPKWFNLIEVSFH